MIVRLSRTVSYCFALMVRFTRNFGNYEFGSWTVNEDHLHSPAKTVSNCQPSTVNRIPHYLVQFHKIKQMQIVPYRKLFRCRIVSAGLLFRLMMNSGFMHLSATGSSIQHLKVSLTILPRSWHVASIRR